MTSTTILIFPLIGFVERVEAGITLPFSNFGLNNQVEFFNIQEIDEHFSVTAAEIILGFEDLPASC